MKCILDILKNWCNPLWVKPAIVSDNLITAKFSHWRPYAYFEFTTPPIVVDYTSGGESLSQTYPPAEYPEDDWGEFLETADTATPIYIRGDVEEINFLNEAHIGPVYIDIHNHTTLRKLTTGGQHPAFTHFEVQDNPVLSEIQISKGDGIVILDLSGNTALAKVALYSMYDIEELILPDGEITFYEVTGPNIRFIHAPNISAATASYMADLITNSSVNNGTVELNPAADSYTTIATAAIAKGWTVINL